MHTVNEHQDLLKIKRAQGFQKRCGNCLSELVFASELLTQPETASIDTNLVANSASDGMLLTNKNKGAFILNHTTI
jgi:hypothetical protein